MKPEASGIGTGALEQVPGHKAAAVATEAGEGACHSFADTRSG